MRFIGKLVKRSIDLVFGSVLSLLLLPVVAFAAIAVMIFEGFPVFYISRLLLTSHQEVRIFKLRTMVRDARSPRYRLQERFMRDGYLDVPLSCEVYTPIGRILERTQLVEVPQLLNVLNGSMSLIGNRPLPAENIRQLSGFKGWEQRFDAPAGITGVAQVVGKHRLEPADRVRLEAAYAGTYRSGRIAWIDLKIAYYTVRLLLTGKCLELEDALDLVGASDERSAGGVDTEVSPVSSGASSGVHELRAGRGRTQHDDGRSPSEVAEDSGAMSPRKPDRSPLQALLQ